MCTECSTDFWAVLPGTPLPPLPAVNMTLTCSLVRQPAPCCPCSPWTVMTAFTWGNRHITMTVSYLAVADFRQRCNCRSCFHPFHR